MASKILIGEKISTKTINAAANKAADEEIAPFGNIHASPDYQKHLSKVLTKRALTKALERTKLVNNSKS